MRKLLSISVRAGWRKVKRCCDVRMCRIVPPSVHGDERRFRVLEAKAFVCHFCLQHVCWSCVGRYVVGLRDELSFVKSEVRETMEESGGLRCEIEQEGIEILEAAQILGVAGVNRVRDGVIREGERNSGIRCGRGSKSVSTKSLNMREVRGLAAILMV